MTTEPKKPLMLLVETFEGDNDFPEMERTINHNDSLYRNWLDKHLFWAFRNNRAVHISPVGDEV